MNMQEELSKLIADAKDIVILQADNPDGDSLASSLALEQILGDMGKNPHLYCGVDIVAHLKYLPGWDRVSNELPHKFDLAIIVDTSSLKLFEQLEKTRQLTTLKSKPVVVIDHHQAVENTLDFARVYINEPGVSTGEVIYDLAQELSWPLNQEAKNMIAVSILSDSLGLMTDSTTPHSIRVIADLVEQGVNLPQLEDTRRQMMRKSPELVAYKGELLQRIEYAADGRLAMITIPWKEIEQYSPEYNPSVLVLDDMRLITDVQLALAFKLYANGRITAKIRANYGYPIAADLAEAFGGGGHPYAAGFKVQDGRTYNEVRQAVIDKTSELLDAAV